MLGFFLALGPSSRSRLAGVVILVAAIFTKQTAAIFLIAAWVALAVSGRPGQAAITLGGGVMVVGVVVAVVSVFEPMFASSLLGEGKTRWDFGEWASQLLELGTAAPDLFIVPMLGLWIWLSDRPRRPTPVILWLAIFGTGLITAAKLGSGLNYFMSLRIVEAMAIGAMLRSVPDSTGPISGQSHRGADCHGCVTRSGHDPVGTKRLAVTVGCQILLHNRGPAFPGLRNESFSGWPKIPSVRLLTDSGLLQLHQKEARRHSSTRSSSGTWSTRGRSTPN